MILFFHFPFAHLDYFLITFALREGGTQSFMLQGGHVQCRNFPTTIVKISGIIISLYYLGSGKVILSSSLTGGKKVLQNNEIMSHG